VLVAQQEAAEVQQMAAQVLEHAAARLAPAPDPVAHRAIAVEHAHAIELADGAVRQQLPEPRDQGLEAVVVGGVPEGAAADASRERLGLGAAREQQGLLHQNGLALGEKAADVVQLALIGRRQDHGVVARRRDVLHRARRGAGGDRIHRGGAAASQQPRPALADIAEAHDQVLHRSITTRPTPV